MPVWNLVCNPSSSNVDPEVLDQWKYNMEHYKDAKTYGHEEYRNQPIEKDAFEFEKYREYKRAESDIQGAIDLIDEADDEELRSMAQDEF